MELRLRQPAWTGSLKRDLVEPWPRCCCQNDRLPHNTPTVLAVKQATSAIPIVFATAGDPVGSGLVASLARPGGNVTGVSSQGSDTAGKRLELLREVVPGLRRLAILANLASSFPVLEDLPELFGAV
jgi:ABC-type uncharacterized transport system substrate-binding protein